MRADRRRGAAARRQWSEPYPLALLPPCRESWQLGPDRVRRGSRTSFARGLLARPLLARGAGSGGAKRSRNVSGAAPADRDSAVAKNIFHVVDFLLDSFLGRRRLTVAILCARRLTAATIAHVVLNLARSRRLTIDAPIARACAASAAEFHRDMTVE